MAVIVFDCPIDPSTLSSINELRLLRLEVLKSQIHNIEGVVETMLYNGVFVREEKDSYRKLILEDLTDKCEEIEERLKIPERVYSDELELYIDILKSP